MTGENNPYGVLQCKSVSHSSTFGKAKWMDRWITIPNTWSCQLQLGALRLADCTRDDGTSALTGICRLRAHRKSVAIDAHAREAGYAYWRKHVRGESECMLCCAAFRDKDSTESQ